MSAHTEEVDEAIQAKRLKIQAGGHVQVLGRLHVLKRGKTGSPKWFLPKAAGRLQSP